MKDGLLAGLHRVAAYGWIPAWTDVPRAPGSFTPYVWRELRALVVGTVMCAVVLGVVLRYGASFLYLPLVFPAPILW